MGAVFDEFQVQLVAWEREYAGRSNDHLIRLCLLALEREEIVSIAYREDCIAARLARMPLTEELQRAIRHALLWAWKDEEMHAIYIRGAIFRLGSRTLRVKALGLQIAGAVGGWSSAVMQHLSWRQAPVSRAIASTMTAVGSFMGQVPEDVKKYLNYGPFRDFCLFNVDAEETAALCWKRMAELADDSPVLPAQCREDFRRVQQDEENHRRVFSIIAEALDERDCLRPGESEASLRTKIAEVGEFFLPRIERKQANPLGLGGRVWVHEVGDAAKPISKATKRSAFRLYLKQTDLLERLDSRRHTLKKSPAEMKIVVKASFMLGYHYADRSPLTDPDLLEELAGFLDAHGFSDLTVGEGRNLYDRFYGNRSVASVAAYFKLHSPRYRLVDFTEDQVDHQYGRGFGHSTIARSWKDADFRLSFGKLRSHPVELVYLSLGNMEGAGARCDEFIFPERQAHRATAIMMMLNDLPPDFALIDAFEKTPDGILGIIASPQPLNPRRFYGGADSLAVDIVAASHIGLGQPRDSSLLRSAMHWFGDPRAHTTVIGCNVPIAGWRSPYHNEVSSLLSLLAYPVYQFSSGRGSLFLPEMDEAAFPPLTRPSLWTGGSRTFLRRLLRFRRPR
jgi:rubrerythrin